MDRKQKILELAGQMGLIQPREVEAAGVHRQYLLRLYRDGDVVRVGRGLTNCFLFFGYISRAFATWTNRREQGLPFWHGSSA